LTVSPQLADIMSQHYGCAFDYIPNCAWLGSEQAVDLEAALAGRAHSEDVIFLVQGGFSSHRGFEILINAWGKMDPHAKLWLRGPDSSEKTAMIDLAKSKNVFDRSVFFPAAVTEAELVRAARDADIGLVPYEPNCLNNRYCSPNKLSQYMAAGLPIISNDLDFVKSVVVDHGVGAGVDFRDEAALVRTINEYVQKRDSIPDLSRKSQELFKTSFNWQAKSQRFYRSIKSIVSKNGRANLDFDFGWTDDPALRISSRDISSQESLSNEIQRLRNVIENIPGITVLRAVRYLWRRAKVPLKAMTKAFAGARNQQ
jgi:glycosyltransferase involved in cell wall biosynthesis